MTNRNKKAKPVVQRSALPVPLLLLAAFGLGAGATWLAMRGSSAPPETPVIENFAGAPGGAPPNVFPATTAAAAEPPDVTQLAPADAARALANWNYDRQNWTHAIEHYEQTITLGADNPDVQTDLGNCYRFLGQGQKALAHYEIAQKQNPQHENSLFNQIGLFAEVLHDKERAASLAREFLARFPQSPQAEAARRFILPAQKTSPSGN